MNIIKRILMAITSDLERTTPPEPEPEVCYHDWHDAGPVIEKRALLESISGIEVEDYMKPQDPCKERPNRFTIHVNGVRYWSNQSSSDYPGVIGYRSFGNVYHYDKKIQGSVCLSCGACIDRITKVREFWEKQVRIEMEKEQIEKDKSTLANKIWKESSCNG